MEHIRRQYLILVLDWEKIEEYHSGEDFSNNCLFIILFTCQKYFNIYLNPTENRNIDFFHITKIFKSVKIIILYTQLIIKVTYSHYIFEIIFLIKSQFLFIILKKLYSSDKYIPTDV